MTEVIFSFDTEDYVNPHAADGIINSARILREAGIKGCYNVVGMLAEALEQWGRYDIIDELSKHHEISTHSRRHSMHPTINEYTDLADANAAIRKVQEDEMLGIEALSRVFGIPAGSITTACPPGISTSYAAHYAYADMGFTAYCGDTVYDAKRSRPVQFCNILALRYNIGLAKILFTADEGFIRDYVENQVAPSDVFVFYHHPQLALCSTYCDVDNFNGVNTPKESWILSPSRAPEEIGKFYKNYSFLVNLIKNDPRFHVTTYSELAKKHGSERTITLDMLPEIRKQLDEYFFPVTYPDSYCLSDIILACRDLLKGEYVHRCGKVYGFLDTPYAAEKKVTLSADEIRALADSFRDGEFLPEVLCIGDKRIGPADWLRAALALLTDGCREYTVAPDGAWQIDLDQFPELRDTVYKGSWMHCKNFEDRFITKRGLLQSWTIRLPKDTPRKIFD